MGSIPVLASNQEGFMQQQELKFYTVFFSEAIKKMNGNRGKMAVQSQHAILHAFWDAEERFQEKALAYKDSLIGGSRAKKVVLVCDDEQAMNNLFDTYKQICGATKVVDVGFTVFNEPTFTCLGIGPVTPSDCDETLKKLKVLI